MQTLISCEALLIFSTRFHGETAVWLPDPLKQEADQIPDGIKYGFLLLSVPKASIAPPSEAIQGGERGEWHFPEKPMETPSCRENWHPIYWYYMFSPKSRVMKHYSSRIPVKCEEQGID